MSEHCPMGKLTGARDDIVAETLRYNHVTKLRNKMLLFQFFVSLCSYKLSASSTGGASVSEACGHGRKSDVVRGGEAARRRHRELTRQMPRTAAD